MSRPDTRKSSFYLSEALKIIRPGQGICEAIYEATDPYITDLLLETRPANAMGLIERIQESMPKDMYVTGWLHRQGLIPARRYDDLPTDWQLQVDEYRWRWLETLRDEHLAKGD